VRGTMAKVSEATIVSSILTANSLVISDEILANVRQASLHIVYATSDALTLRARATLRILRETCGAT
jgi:hypothetical protein